MRRRGEAWPAPTEEEARRREELDRSEARLDERRAGLDRKYDILDQKERLLDEREAAADAKAAGLREREGEVERLTKEARARLEALAGMSPAEAKKQLVAALEAGTVRAATPDALSPAAGAARSASCASCAQKQSNSRAPDGGHHSVNAAA